MSLVQLLRVAVTATVAERACHSLCQPLLVWRVSQSRQNRCTAPLSARVSLPLLHVQERTAAQQWQHSHNSP